MTVLTDAQIYKNVEKQIESMNVRHVEINPKSIAVGANAGEFTARNTDGRLEVFRFTEMGAGCFQWFTRGYKISDVLLDSLKYAKFTEAVRFYQEKGLTDSKIKTRQLKLLTKIGLLISTCFIDGETFWLHLMGDSVVGMTRQWNDTIPHEFILDSIRERGFLKKITNHHYSSKAFSIDLKINDADTRFFLRIQNGHSGHETMSYSVVARFKNWEFISNEHGAARHLANLSDVFGQIGDVLEKMKAKNLTEKLDDTKGVDFLKQMKSYLNARSSIVTDNYIRGDARIAVKKITDVQAEKLEALINKLSSRITGMKYTAFTLIEVMMEMSQKEKGVKGAAEILANAMLLDVFDSIK